MKRYIPMLILAIIFVGAFAVLSDGNDLSGNINDVSVVDQDQAYCLTSPDGQSVTIVLDSERVATYNQKQLRQGTCDEVIKQNNSFVNRLFGSQSEEIVPASIIENVRAVNE